MKIFWALVVSLAIHIVIFLLLNKNEFIFENTTKQHQKQTQHNTTIRHVKLLQQQVLQPKQVEPKNYKKAEENKINKQLDVHKNEILPLKNISKNPLLELPIPVKIPSNPLVAETPKVIKQQEIKHDIKQEAKQEAKKENQNKDLTTENKVVNQIDNVTKSYLDLYKDDFDKFSDETKVYLIKNISDIGRITERFLIYPYIGIQAHQQGVNVVEFWLYPDGKISKPKIIKSSNYYILDDNTEETILKAYRDYPTPDKPTVIRIYVRYRLI
ncbi:MAG: TonB family protein [Arcobacter sp.]|nr:TonB family protein [Arcobacter sp.]